MYKVDVYRKETMMVEDPHVLSVWDSKRVDPVEEEQWSFQAETKHYPIHILKYKQIDNIGCTYEVERRVCVLDDDERLPLLADGNYFVSKEKYDRDIANLKYDMSRKEQKINKLNKLRELSFFDRLFRYKKICKEL